MHQLIKNVINSGDYELEALLNRIDTMFVRGKITEEQEVELIRLARENADPVHSYAPLQKRVDALYTEMDSLRGILEALEDRIATLESDGTEPEESEVPEEPTEQEEWPQYVQPTGAHDAYNTGDKITYNGVHYICLMDGCVWSPDVYPNGWTTEEEHEEPEEPSTLPASLDGEALQEEVK